MSVTHYIGFDIHKKSIQYCVKAADGGIVGEGTLRAQRRVLVAWAEQRPEPWQGAMEATLFSGWIYDTLQPYAAEWNMAHPLMMKAIGASKKKSDRIDVRKIADMVRCHRLPVCYVAPAEMRELRRLLRYQKRDRNPRSIIEYAQYHNISGVSELVAASQTLERPHLVVLLRRIN